jgi:mRNA-degrading endonuclease toxin of MazEF toxin-antitoxin module
VGSEQNHEDATPWLVVSSDAVHARYPIAIVVPLTSKLGKMDDFRGARIVVPESQKLPGKDGAPLSGDSLVLTEQVRVIAHERIIKGPVAKLSTAAMASVEAGLKHVLDMP